MADVIDQLLPQGRQLVTNAHPLVEITVMREPTHGHTLVHLVNASGHADTAYFTPVEMRDIAIELDGTFRIATALNSTERLPVSATGHRSRFIVPRLGAYEVVVLEK